MGIFTLTLAIHPHGFQEAGTSLHDIDSSAFSHHAPIPPLYKQQQQNKPHPKGMLPGQLTVVENRYQLGGSNISTARSKLHLCCLQRQCSHPPSPRRRCRSNACRVLSAQRSHGNWLGWSDSRAPINHACVWSYPCFVTSSTMMMSGWMTGCRFSSGWMGMLIIGRRLG